MAAILVAFASKYGSTREIAEKIATVLGEKGMKTDVSPVNKTDSLQGYDAIVLGSGVYMGLWRRDAVNFLKKYTRELTDKRVWLFSSGPTGEGDPLDLLNGWTFPKGLLAIAEQIKPIDYAVFGGNVNEEKLSWFHKWIIHKVKAPVGDYRNWPAVTAWASDIASFWKNRQ